MIKLKVLQVYENCKYQFQKDNGDKLSLIIELYEANNLRQGDLVEMSEELLDGSSPNFVQPYAFQKCEKSEFEKLNQTEKMIITSNGVTILLKRIYG